MIDLNRISVGVLAGIISGLLAGGIGSRAAMRIVALVTGIPSEFTVEGTFIILFLGAFLGGVFGLIFLVVRRWVPLPDMWRGLLYGAILLLIFVVPPFLSPGGEFALASPLTGFIIFGPIPIAYGIGLALIAARLEQKYQTTLPRRVGLAWLIPFGLALFLSLVNAIGSDETVRLFYPPALFSLLAAWDISARSTEGLKLILMVTFLLGYWSLAIIIFWRGSASWLAKFAAIAFLTFAAAFFNTGEILGGAMSTLPLVRLVPGLIRMIGLASMLALFFLFPDGRFIPGWTRPTIIVWSLWLLVWFLNPFPTTALDPQVWPELLQWTVVVSGLGSGATAQIIRYRQSAEIQQRRQIKWVVISVTGTVLSFALLWLLLIIFPDLRVRAVPGLYAIFAFFLYWLPWFLVPISIVFAMWRYRLWDTTTS